MIQNSEKVSSEYTLWHVAEPFQSFETSVVVNVTSDKIGSPIVLRSELSLVKMVSVRGIKTDAKYRLNKLTILSGVSS